MRHGLSSILVIPYNIDVVDFKRMYLYLDKS